LTTDAITAHVMEIFGTTPTARLLEFRKTAFDNASKADKAEARKRYEAAIDAKVKETQTIHAQKYSAWRNRGAAIKAQLSAYFSGSQLASDWDALDTAMISFMRLGTGDCDRSSDVKGVRSYLAGDPTSANIQWPLLEKSYYTDSGCYVGDWAGFRYTYNYVGSRLIVKQQRILDSIMKADMVGFSRGWNDLITDVISGGG
jgi:hypothetical protein